MGTIVPISSLFFHRTLMIHSHKSQRLPETAISRKETQAFSWSVFRGQASVLNVTRGSEPSYNSKQCSKAIPGSKHTHDSADLSDSCLPQAGSWRRLSILLKSSAVQQFINSQLRTLKGKQDKYSYTRQLADKTDIQDGSPHLKLVIMSAVHVSSSIQERKHLLVLIIPCYVTRDNMSE